MLVSEDEVPGIETAESRGQLRFVLLKLFYSGGTFNAMIRYSLNRNKYLYICMLISSPAGKTNV